jgi:hypothetical protein
VVVAWKYLYEYYAVILRRSTKGIRAGVRAEEETSKQVL